MAQGRGFSAKQQFLRPKSGPKSRKWFKDIKIAQGRAIGVFTKAAKVAKVVQGREIVVLAKKNRFKVTKMDQGRKFSAIFFVQKVGQGRGNRSRSLELSKVALLAFSPNEVVQGHKMVQGCGFSTKSPFFRPVKYVNVTKIGQEEAEKANLRRT